MKNFKSKIPVIFRILIITSAAVLVLSSCNEGLFNFSDETGNVSISFTASGVPTQLDKVEITLTNDESGDKIERNSDIYDSNGNQQADAYIPRIDTGSWRMYIKVFNSGGLVVAEREDYFELELGKTVIAEYEYYDGGVVDLFFDAPSGGQSVSLIEIYSVDTLVSAYHIGPSDVGNAMLGVTNIIQGSNFDRYLNGIRVDYPDSGYFELDGGWSRSLNGIKVEMQSDSVSVRRNGFGAAGEYKITLTDTEGVETSSSDSCFFNFSADTGFATFTGNSYTGGNIELDMYELNEASGAGTVFAYGVDRTDGTNTSTNILTAIDPLSLPAPIPVGGTFMGMNIVLVTLDIEFDKAQAAFDSDYAQFSTDLSLDELPVWLYMLFGEQLNYIGISVYEY